MSRKKDNIVLIGMPGCGKSTMGVLLAKELGMGFADTDLMLQSSYGKLVRDIIRDSGRDGFLAAEERMLASLISHHCVIATGGSAVYGEKAMTYLRSIGTIVYIKQKCDILKARVGDEAQRGIVMRDGQTFEAIYAERVPMYERYADIIVSGSGDPAEVVARIIAQLSDEQ